MEWENRSGWRGKDGEVEERKKDKQEKRMLAKRLRMLTNTTNDWFWRNFGVRSDVGAQLQGSCTCAVAKCGTFDIRFIVCKMDGRDTCATSHSIRLWNAYLWIASNKMDPHRSSSYFFHSSPLPCRAIAKKFLEIVYGLDSSRRSTVTSQSVLFLLQSDRQPAAWGIRCGNCRQRTMPGFAPFRPVM